MHDIGRATVQVVYLPVNGIGNGHVWDFVHVERLSSFGDKFCVHTEVCINVLYRYSYFIEHHQDKVIG